MSLQDFKILDRLGSGAYSSVYRVQRKEDKQIYALKRVKLMNLSEKEKQNALNEVRILASIRHPNIICYKEAFLDEESNSLCIIMEFCDNGDLYQKITSYQKQKSLLKEADIFSIFIQITKGLKELHKLKILHRDLKSANVFLCKDGTVKLGDMNVSKVAKKGLLYTQTGTPYYASPEVWKDTPYESKSDVWSLGCVLYEMTTLKPPFRAEDMEGLYKRVIRGQYPRIQSCFSQDLSSAISQLLQVSPHSRPTCDKILSLPGVVKHMKEKINIEADEHAKTLMQTIKIPKNLHYLTDRLPKANYTPLKLKKVEQQEHFLQTMAGYDQSKAKSESNSSQIMYLPKLQDQSKRQSSNSRIQTSVNHNNNNSILKAINQAKQDLRSHSHEQRKDLKESNLVKKASNMQRNRNLSNNAQSIEYIISKNQNQKNDEIQQIQQQYNQYKQILKNNNNNQKRENSLEKYIQKETQVNNSVLDVQRLKKRQKENLEEIYGGDKVLTQKKKNLQQISKKSGLEKSLNIDRSKNRYNRLQESLIIKDIQNNMSNNNNNNRLPSLVAKQ